MKLLLLGILLVGCASTPRYDSQGNGTSLPDRFIRWSVHTVNNEHF